MHQSLVDFTILKVVAVDIFHEAMIPLACSAFFVQSLAIIYPVISCKIDDWRLYKLNKYRKFKFKYQRYEDKKLPVWSRSVKPKLSEKLVSGPTNALVPVRPIFCTICGRPIQTFNSIGVCFYCKTYLNLVKYKNDKKEEEKESKNIKDQ